MNDTSQITPKPKCKDMFTQVQMESYAKTQAISFQIWVENNCTKLRSRRIGGYYRMKSTPYTAFEALTPDELYTKWMEEQSK